MLNDTNKEFKNVKGSKLAQYQQLILGSRSLLQLLKFELIILFTSKIPGALGLFLRSKLFPRIMGSCGRNVVFGTDITIRHPGKIHIGDNVIIDDNCLLDAKGADNKGISIGDNVFIGRNTILSCKNGDIELKTGVNIGFNCEIFSSNQVILGDYAIVAAYTYLVGGEGYNTTITGKPIQKMPIFDDTLRLIVGGGSWLGTHVVVLNGVQIGEGAVVAAGAVVTKSIGENAIAGGIPAKEIGRRQPENKTD